jgi:hypothetical protein
VAEQGPYKALVAGSTPVPPTKLDSVAMQIGVAPGSSVVSGSSVRLGGMFG